MIPTSPSTRATHLARHTMNTPLPRREFLRRSGSTVGAAVLGSLTLPVSPVTAAAPAPAAAAAAPTNVSLGFSLYGMKALPVATALKTCAEIGYENVEFALMPGWPTEPKLLSATDRRQIAATLDGLGLKVSALMENLSPLGTDADHKRNLERLAAAAMLGDDLSRSAQPVIETVLGGNPKQWDAVREPMAERLRAWGGVAEAYQTVIAVKPHVGGALHTPEGALWLLRAVNHPWIKLTYDFSHYELRGYELAATLKELAPHASFIHVKDSEGTADKFKFLLPGEGRIDYASYAARLKATPYRGPVVVEVSGLIFNQKGYDPLAAARKSYTALAPHFQKKG